MQRNQLLKVKAGKASRWVCLSLIKAWTFAWSESRATVGLDGVDCWS